MKMKRFLLVLAVSLTTAFSFAQPKYIFFMIGDGMGLGQVAATEMYQGALDDLIMRKPLCMTQFPYTGLSYTYSASNGITDSSAAGTCLATGHKTNNGREGLDPKGEAPQTIAEYLHNQGWAIGIMTSVSIDHATPAAYYAHVMSRSDYYTIGRQLGESGFDFFGGATFYHPNCAGHPDEPNLYNWCTDHGYTFCRGYEDFLQHSSTQDKVILIQQHEGLTKDYEGEGRVPYAIDRKPGDLTLEQITRASIEFLSAKKKPFFMMVEGGQIDWSCHSDDAATTLQEVIDFDLAIRQAYAFYKQHPDETLIVVTADHETGGMALGNSDYTLNFGILKNQKASAFEISARLKDLQATYGKKLQWEQVKSLFKETLGLYDAVEVTADEDKALQATFKASKKHKAADVKTLYASLSALSDQAVALLDKKAKVGWTTHAHSGAPVPVYAIGVGAEQFTGVYDNSDIMPRLKQIATGK